MRSTALVALLALATLAACTPPPPPEPEPVAVTSEPTYTGKYK